MIVVKCSEDNFIYDVHSLVKAFYPETDVKVFKDGEKDISSSEGFIELNITYEPDALTICTTDGLVKKACGLDYEDRPNYKNALKLTLYALLSEVTGKELPWGTLTGIRPTKIAKGLIDSGADKEEVREYMKNTYRCSDEKAYLSADIAEYENRILQPIDYENGYSLYIGIPFCPSTCLYCSFTSYPIVKFKNKVKDYIEAVKKEIDYVAASFSDKTLDSVYIGGGTPTTLEAEELKDLIEYLKSKLDMSKIKEFTVEAGRADSITEEKLRVLYDQGVSRISVNPQTMNEETLRIIGRKATAAETVRIYKMAREIGFDNINMDLIVGLPNEDIDDVRDTLNKVKELNPDSLTVHSLAIKRASRLAQVIDQMGYETINNSDDIMTLTGQVAEAMDMKPYYLYRQKNMSGNFENVGYAKEGKAGIYNILIMEEVQTIVALGAGTVTKRVYPVNHGDVVSGSPRKVNHGDGVSGSHRKVNHGDGVSGSHRIERCDNVKDVDLYINGIDEMIERKKKLFS